MRSYQKYPKALDKIDYLIVAVLVAILLGLAAWGFFT